MCGIVGVLTSFHNGLSWNETKIFRDMLFLDQLRGMDSTGTFSVSNKGNVDILKGAMHGTDFVQHKDFDDFCQGATRNGMFVVGHNRAATRGTVKDENAHPFWVDDKIILVQNGTYKGDHKHLKDTEVDTHAIAHVLAEEEDVEKAMQKIDAAYALVWYNVKEKSLNILRNDERPLFIAYTDTGTMLFASEPEFILFSASRQNTKLKGKPYLLKDHSLFTATINSGGGWSSTNKDVDTKYRFQFQKKYNEFLPATRQPVLQSDDNEIGSDDDPYWMRFQRQMVGAANSKSEVTMTMHHHVHNNRFKDWEVSSDEALELIGALEIKKSRKVIFEVIDYLKTNNRHDCDTYYLVGRECTANDDANSALFYQLMTGTTEQKLMRLIYEEPIRCGQISTVIEHKNLGEKRDKHVVTALIINSTAMIHEETPNATH